MSLQKTPGLQRAIGLPQATAMVAGTIIGASIFVQPSEITGHIPSVAGIFLVWLVSGVLTFFGALVCAELASIFTQTGGVYVFLKESFSPSIGFLWGWGMFWSIHSGIIAAIAVIFARYVGYFVHLGDFGIRAVSIAVIFVISAVNYLGVKQGSAMQTLFTLGKVLAIIVLVILGFIFGSRGQDHFVMDEAASAGISMNDFFIALVAGLFAFGGWHMVTYSAEETINPRRTIPQALMIGTLLVTLCYIALNAVYMYVLPLEVVASSKRIAADAADKLFGYGGGSFMSALVIFSTFGALSGIILCGPRVYYSMAKDGLLFRWIGAIHPRYNTPHKAIVIQAVWSSILVLTGTYRALFTRVVYTEWIFFALMAIGLILLRRKLNVVRGYRIWCYPVIPALFIISSLAIVTNQIISDPGESVFGFSLVLAGLPVYFLWARKKRRRNTDDY
jgi:APA family basic amino acid/polyamine antiporter